MIQYYYIYTHTCIYNMYLTKDKKKKISIGPYFYVIAFNILHDDENLLKRMYLLHFNAREHPKYSIVNSISTCILNYSMDIIVLLIYYYYVF